MLKTFNYLLIYLDMPDIDIEKPICDFTKPSDPKVQLILRLYSMEPPFYADLSGACRNMDPSKLKTLGPFAMAIFKVIYGGNYSNKRRDDDIEHGNQFYKHDDLGYMCRSFLLFRGALMYSEWIKDWSD